MNRFMRCLTGSASYVKKLWRTFNRKQSLPDRAEFRQDAPSYLIKLLTDKV